MLIQAPQFHMMSSAATRPKLVLSVLFFVVAAVSAGVVLKLGDRDVATAEQWVRAWFAPATTEPAPAVALTPPNLYLIRTTLLTLDAANRTGNYSVLRETAAPAFQNSNTPESLAHAFRTVRETIDLGAIALEPPVLTRPPTRLSETHLQLSGQIGGATQVIAFEMVFEAVQGHWRLAALAVGRANR